MAKLNLAFASVLQRTDITDSNGVFLAFLLLLFFILIHVEMVHPLFTAVGLRPDCTSMQLCSAS